MLTHEKKEQNEQHAPCVSLVCTCAASYVMVLVSVCTMGTSFVAISVFWAANVSDIVTISVFTTGGWGGTRERSEGGRIDTKRVNTLNLRQLRKHKETCWYLCTRFGNSLPSQSIHKEFCFCYQIKYLSY